MIGIAIVLSFVFGAWCMFRIAEYYNKRIINAMRIEEQKQPRVSAVRRRPQASPLINQDDYDELIETGHLRKTIKGETA